MVDEALRALRDDSRSGGSAVTYRDASERRLDTSDVLVSTALCLGMSAVAAIPGWLFLSGSLVLYVGLMIAVMAAGWWLARRSPVSATLALGYSALLGLLVGAFSSAAAYSSAPGSPMSLIYQALVGTAAGSISILAVSATRWGQRAGRAKALFSALLLGYFIVAVASFVSALLGVGGGWGFYGVSGWGLILCAIGVALSAWSLLVNITTVRDALAMNPERRWQWSFGMSISSSIVWMYLEILRLLAIVQR